MIEFKYEIRLSPEGRPFIHLSDDYNENPEDKFMTLELTRYMLINIYNHRRAEATTIDMKAMESTLETLELISDEVATLIKRQMELMGEAELLTHRNYHIQVETKEQRDNLNYEGIIYNEKIFKREPGLKVLVYQDMKIYELREGKDNEHWVEV